MKLIWKKLLEDLERDGLTSLSLKPQILPFSLAIEIKKNQKATIFVAPTEENAKELCEKAATLLSTEEVLHWLPSLVEDVYGPLAPHPSVVLQRASVLTELMNAKKKTLFVSPSSLLFKVPKIGFYRNHHMVIEKGAEYSLAELKSFLWSIGYKKVDLVEGSGEYSIRGSLLDIFPPELDFGLRVEFFGNTIEELRFFDPAIQKSFSSADGSFTIKPLSEVIKSDDALFNLRQKLRESGEFGEIRIECLAKSGSYPTLQVEARFDEDIFGPLPEFIGECRIVSLSRANKAFIQNERNKLEEEFKKSCKPSFISPEKIFSKKEVIEDNFEECETENDIPVDRINLIPSKLVDNLNILDEKVKKGCRVIVTFSNKGSAERVKELAEKEISSAVLFESFPESFPPALYFVNSPPIESVEFPKSRWAVISERELIGKGVIQVETKGRKRDVFFEGLRDLKIGDYVVHTEHGIGLYRGIEAIKRGDKEEDFVHIEYADNGKLLLPIERLDLIQKYKGPEGFKPQVDKLGTLSFKKRKEKAKKAVQDVAEDLIKIYAARRSAESIPIFGDKKIEEEFENLFPYDLTSDQKKALEDVKKDLESSTPMDRIICGDVGFGKTEIAMRAAFKVANSKRQVAILCPTTVLALQHYENFKERFSLFPINIEMLSSLIPAKRQKEIVKEIKAGMVDIIIGTHRILSKDVDIPKLGLFIVDEEQRFGVLHKEKIKKTKPWVHFLTLSATPIPRTLQMGISTIVDMSLIETAPKDRLSIETVFSVYDEELIKSAIRNEIKRDGQIFYLYNKVEDIEQKAGKIRELVPEGRIIIAHGQLNKSELEKRMVQFYHHQADILLSTTIIENGVDIPKANTLIVENAQNFGLTELYQIRGRIGRSNIPAYAYLLIPPRQQISKDAVDRLRTLEEFTELGSGFRIAAIDLELRGAGTLLGKQQSGHIESIGFELYMRLLEEAVSELKGYPLREVFRTEMRLLSKMSIPKIYIENDNERLTLYRELSLAESESQVDKIGSEMNDRYGDYPEEVKTLLKGTKRRIEAEKFLIEKIIEAKDSISIFFGKDSPVEPKSLISVISERKETKIKENVVNFPLLKNESGLDFLKVLFSKLKISGKN